MRVRGVCVGGVGGGGGVGAAETDAMIGRGRRGGGLCMTLKTKKNTKIKAAEHGGGCSKWKRRKKKRRKKKKRDLKRRK